MMAKTDYRQDKIRISLERALWTCWASLPRRPCCFAWLNTTTYPLKVKKCTLSEVESALNGIFGAGASIITEMIYHEMAALW